MGKKGETKERNRVGRRGRGRAHALQWLVASWYEGGHHLESHISYTNHIPNTCTYRL